MDLFIVRRYDGQESEEQLLKQKEAQEKKILEQLNARKKRKAALEENDGNKPEPSVVTNTVTTPEEEPSAKRKRKSKKSIDTDKTLPLSPEKQDSYQVQGEEPVVATTEQKRLKKKKRKRVDESQVEPNDTAQEEPEAQHPSSPKDLEELPVANSDLPEESCAEDGNDVGFTIVGEVEQKDREQVRRVLPKWLSHPSIVTGSLQDREFAIEHLSQLHPYLAKRLIKSKITHFFPVQRQVLPYLMEGIRKPNVPKNDICVSAPTGSGKTLAFVLPILQAVFGRTQVAVRALVVAPVADLALQIYRVFSSYSATESSKIKVALLAGQLPFNQEQKMLCRKGKLGQWLPLPDIVVATPGRLLDHIQRTPGFDLSQLQFVVLDEADRILEEASADWLQTLQKAWQRSSQDRLNAHCLLNETLPPPPQKLLFSATLTQDPEKLSRLGLFQPKLFTTVVEEHHARSVSDDKFVGKFTTPAELTESFVTCMSNVKPLLVYHYLQEASHKPALVFANSRQATHRLAVVLQSMGGLRAEEFSSTLTKKRRSQILRSFAAGELDVLVTTDAVARGMDLGVVDCVISYDPPPYIKNYVHRVGRCARAGRKGTALSVLTLEQVGEFREMLEKAEKYNVHELEITEEDLAVYEDEYQSALASLRGTLAEERANNIEKSAKARGKGRFNRKDRDPNAPKGINKKKTKNAYRQQIKPV